MTAKIKIKNNTASKEHFSLIEYRLTESAAGGTRKRYGIEAQSSDKTQICVSENISNDKDFVERIVNILNCNRVPLVHFLDIVEDMIEESELMG